MKDIILGIIVGVANIVPGVSGGTFLFISGKYEKLIETVNSLLKFKVDRKKFLFLLKIGLGIAFGIIIFSKLLHFLYQNYSEYCLAVFSGFIAGGVVSMSKKVSLTPLSIFITILAFIMSLILLFSTPRDLPPEFFILVLGGIFAAFSMVLPGISGSFILLIMGIYDDVIHAVSKVNMKILVPVGIGMIIGFILVFKALEIFVKRSWNTTIAFLLGLTIAGVIRIFPYRMNFLTILLLVLSFSTALKFPTFFGK